EDDVMTSELQRRLRELIASLPKKLRDALLLAGSGDHSYEEIGQILKIPIGTVKWRGSAGRKKMEKKRKRGGGDGGGGGKGGWEGGGRRLEAGGQERLDLAIDRAVREMLDVEPPAHLRAKVVAQIDSLAASNLRPQAKGAGSWKIVFVPLAAAAVLILAVLLR